MKEETSISAADEEQEPEVAEEKTEAKGEINFRCSRQHSIWVTRYGKAWR